MIKYVEEKVHNWWLPIKFTIPTNQQTNEPAMPCLPTIYVIHPVRFFLFSSLFNYFKEFPTTILCGGGDVRCGAMRWIWCWFWWWDAALRMQWGYRPQLKTKNPKTSQWSTVNQLNFRQTHPFFIPPASFFYLITFCCVRDLFLLLHRVSLKGQPSSFDKEKLVVIDGSYI